MNCLPAASLTVPASPPLSPRSPGRGADPWLALLLFSLSGCGGEAPPPAQPGGGGTQSAPAGSAASGEMTGSGAPSGGATGGAGAGGTSTAGSAGNHVAPSCDTRQVLCRAAPPDCGEGRVPQVVNGCFGECVAIDECACQGPEECPDPDGTQPYTCLAMAQHCSYWLR